MFNIAISSAQNRTGRSTCAKILSKVLDMPKTSAGDLLRIFALEYMRGIKRGVLVGQFIEGKDLSEIFDEHKNLTSQEFVEFHTNIADKDKSFDVEIEKYVIKTLLKGGWIIDTVIGNIIINSLQDSSSGVYEKFISTSDFTIQEANVVKDNSVLIYFKAEIEVRASRSAYYETLHGHETSVEKEKHLLEHREKSNRERYLNLYNFDLYDGSKLFDLEFDTSAQNPVDICTTIIQTDNRINERARMLGITNIRKEVEKNADW